MLDSKGRVQDFRNIDIPDAKTYSDSLAFAESMSKQLLNENHSIRISLDDGIPTDYIDVCYSDSLMLRRLAF